MREHWSRYQRVQIKNPWEELPKPRAGIKFKIDAEYDPATRLTLSKVFIQGINKSVHESYNRFGECIMEFVNQVDLSSKGPIKDNAAKYALIRYRYETAMEIPWYRKTFRFLEARHLGEMLNPQGAFNLILTDNKSDIEVLYIDKSAPDYFNPKSNLSE